METPKSIEEYTKAMEKMQVKIDAHKSIIDETGRKRLKIEKSINEQKFLQDKAKHIIQMNEEKAEKLKNEMQQIEMTFMNLKSCSSSSTPTDDTADVFQAIIIQLGIVKTRLSNDIRHLQQPIKNGDKVKMIIQELELLLNKVQRLKGKILIKLNELKSKKISKNVKNEEN